MSIFDRRMTKATVAVLLVLALVVIPMTIAFAGQPNQDCANFSSTPGHAASAPGSAFNPDGHAGTVYAGEQPQNSNNIHSVSQYDVACRNVSSH